MKSRFSNKAILIGLKLHLFVETLTWEVGSSSSVGRFEFFLIEIFGVQAWWSIPHSEGRKEIEGLTPVSVWSTHTYSGFQLKESLKNEPYYRKEGRCLP